jgi:undecaprenyl-diphosphatase
VDYNFLEVILLGIIEGITEFLPISSTGHLLIAEHWLGKRSDLFNIAIQSGAMLAVIVIYWRHIIDMLRRPNEASNRDYLSKLIGSFLVTAALGAVVKFAGIALPETVRPVAWALILGGVFILWVEWLARGWTPNERVTWTVAIAVGAAQVLAGVFPGTSRSTATIFVAMLAGTTSRPAATEFAFLVGIPTMFAASLYEFFKLSGTDAFAHEPWPDLALGFVVSAIVAFIAVKWLLQYIQTHTFTIFAWYRIAIGALLLFWILPNGY